MLGSILPNLRQKLAPASRPFTRHANLRTDTLFDARQKQFFETNGYLILPGALNDKTVSSLRDHLDDLWTRRATLDDVAIDLHFNTPDEERVHFRKAAAQARNQPYKILDLHLVDDIVRGVCTDRKIVDILRHLLDANPIVCNSLFFEWGSQQYPHFDTFFMPSPTRNKMAASWIALDRVTETNGPLYYYPKSHLIEPYRFSHGGINAVFSEVKTTAQDHIDRIIREHGLVKEFFLPKPGDILIWHAQLLHGGSPIINPAERRRSIVTHYWTDVDYPDAEQRIDLGDRRWLLRKPHQFVVDEDVMESVDAFLAQTDAPPETRGAVPDNFDPRLYLARNQDVLLAGENPWRHYVVHGRKEGRIW